MCWLWCSQSRLNGIIGWMMLVVVIELGVGVGWLSGFCITSSSSSIEM